MPLHTGAIRDYYEAFDLSCFSFDTFYEWMTLVDGIWLEQVSERSKNEREKAKARSKSPIPKRR